MTPAFEALVQQLKRLPGLGYRSAERLALHLLVERPGRLPELIDALQVAASTIIRCPECGNLSEGGPCSLCADEARDASRLCFVEHVPDLLAIERSGAYRGFYHVLHGKLSPINQVGPEHLNLAGLDARLERMQPTEIILALPNDIEGEATCHYLKETHFDALISVTRIGFGLPSGGGVLYADAVTLKSALEGRRAYH